MEQMKCLPHNSQHVLLTMHALNKHEWPNCSLMGLP